MKSIINRIINKIKRTLNSGKTEKQGWFGNYSSWTEAQKDCRGYDDVTILNKVLRSTLLVKEGRAAYERDSVAFNEHEYSQDLLRALKASVVNNELTIIDFGGALGSTYFQYKRFFDGVAINWFVVEQKHFVDCGNKHVANKELRFFETIENAQAFKKSNVILLSCVLPYLENPYGWLNTIKSFNFERIIIDRNPFINASADMLTVQYVPESIYKASYPSWFFSETKMLDFLGDKYGVKFEFVSPFTQPAEINNKQAVWKGYLLEHK